MRSLLSAAVLAALLFGCGYHFPGQENNLPDDVRTVYVDLFVNRTAEPFLENEVTNAVLDQFARGRALTVLDSPMAADALLTGSVIAYSSVPVAYGVNDEILEYRSTMTIRASLRRPDSGRILWKGDVAWREEYPASDDKTVQEDSESAAIEVLSRRIAEEIYNLILSDF